MKKIFLYISILLIITSVILIIVINVKINNNINETKKIIEYINNLSLPDTTSISYSDYPKMQIYKKDYIGVLKNNSLKTNLPISANCNDFIQSLCLSRTNKLVLIGTNLSDSVKNYKDIQISDKFILQTFLGGKIPYKVSKIIHSNNIKSIYKYNYNLILIIKDYYQFEYTAFLCN